MGQQVSATNGPRTYTVAVGTAVTAKRLLTMDSNGDVSHAGITDDVLGVAETSIPAAAADRPRGDTIGVCPINHAGSVRVIASEAITIDTQLEKAADGKVAAEGGAGEALNLIALTAASADGDEIEAATFR